MNVDEDEDDDGLNEDEEACNSAINYILAQRTGRSGFNVWSVRDGPTRLVCTNCEDDNFVCDFCS